MARAIVSKLLQSFTVSLKERELPQGSRAASVIFENPSAREATSALCTIAFPHSPPRLRQGPSSRPSAQLT